MKHVNLDDCDEAVKRFVLSLVPDSAGSVIEIGGRPIVCVLPVPGSAEVVDDWNAELDVRRCELIDHEIAGTLTPDTAVELARLQTAMLRHRRQVAPLPLEDVRRLREELLAQAAGPNA